LNWPPSLVMYVWSAAMSLIDMGGSGVAWAVAIFCTPPWRPRPRAGVEVAPEDLDDEVQATRWMAARVAPSPYPQVPWVQVPLQQSAFVLQASNFSAQHVPFTHRGGHAPLQPPGWHCVPQQSLSCEQPPPFGTQHTIEHAAPP
jgi:hypothetical protein